MASRVRRLMPLGHHPERFHEEKSEVAHDMATLAEALSPSNGRSAYADGNPRTATVVMTGTHRVNGRTVRVERRTRVRAGFSVFVGGQ